MSEEPDFGCYQANFSFPAKGECVGCQYYEKCKQICEREIEEEEEFLKQ